MKQDKLSWAHLVSDAEAKQLPLIDYLLERSATQMETDTAAVLTKMNTMLQVMEEAVAYGMTGVKSNSGLSGGSAKKLKEYSNAVAISGKLGLLGPVAGTAVMYALAAAEANAAMGRIVAAPTAGASGILPGVLLSLKEQYSDYDTVGARVISKGSGNWFSSFTIDKGRDLTKKDIRWIFFLMKEI